MSPFDDDTIINRVFDALDDLRKNQSETCVSLAEVKTILTAHLDSEKLKSERKEKIFYGILGVFAAIVSIIEVVRSGIIG